MPVKDSKRPFYIYAADIQPVTQRSLSTCRRLLRKVRKKHHIAPYHPVPLLYFLEYMHINDVETIYSYFPQLKPGGKDPEA